ncbi:hypothetical protein MYOV003v1_p0218 [Vibrio phage 207E48.1]|nr:hypothetical protein MYOV003v1_p0218 [Vibrio phage 207E48.1]
MKNVQINHDMHVAVAWMKNTNGDYDVNFTRDGVSIGVNPKMIGRLSKILRVCNVRIDVMRTRVRLELETLGDLFNVVTLLYKLSGINGNTNHNFGGDRNTFRAEAVPQLVVDFMNAYKFHVQPNEGVGTDQTPESLSIFVAKSGTHIQVLPTVIDMTLDSVDQYTPIDC